MSTYVARTTGAGYYRGGREFRLTEVTEVKEHQHPYRDGWLVTGPDGAEMYLSDRYYNRPEQVTTEGTVAGDRLPILPAWREELAGGAE